MLWKHRILVLVWLRLREVVYPFYNFFEDDDCDDDDDDDDDADDDRSCIKGNQGSESS